MLPELTGISWRNISITLTDRVLSAIAWLQQLC